MAPCINTSNSISVTFCRISLISLKDSSRAKITRLAPNSFHILTLAQFMLFACVLIVIGMSEYCFTKLKTPKSDTIIESTFRLSKYWI